MRLETFFEKFDQLADAPNAVAKMRQLVLQLAVQGNLVSHSSDDQTAATLAVKISEDRAAFVKVKNLGRQRVLKTVTDDQRPFALPSCWVWTRLGNLCRVQAGFAFESAAFSQDNSGVPMIRIRDITSDRTQVNYLGEYREEFLVETGDYLVGMDGNFTVAKWRGPQALLNQRVSRLQWYSNQLEPSFFAIAAQHQLTGLQGKKAYTTVDHLSSKQIEDAVVPLPPLDEQKRIVAKVDELMALCDRLEAQQKERESRHAALARASLARFAAAPCPSNLILLFHPSYTISPPDLRKAILTLGIQGKLVAQEPNDEPAAELLSQLQTSTSSGKQRNSSPSTPDLPFDIPPSWIVTHLDAVTRVFSGNAFHSSDFQKQEAIRAIKITNVGVRDFKESDEFLPSGFERRYSNFLVRQGDILMALTRPYILDGLKVARCPVSYDGALLNQRVGAIQTVKGKDISRFLYLYLCSDFVLKYVIEKSRTLNQPNLNVPDLRRLPLPLPPLSEQCRIVAKVDQLMESVAQLETQLTASQATAVELLVSLVEELTAPA